VVNKTDWIGIGRIAHERTRRETRIKAKAGLTTEHTEYTENRQVAQEATEGTERRGRDTGKADGRDATRVSLLRGR